MMRAYSAQVASRDPSSTKIISTEYCGEAAILASNTGRASASIFFNRFSSLYAGIIKDRVWAAGFWRL